MFKVTHYSDRHIIWLMGGLGNQLFQIQFGLWLTEKSSNPIIFNRTLTRMNYLTRALRWSIHSDVLDQILVTDQLSFSCKIDPCAIILSKAPLLNNYSCFYDDNFLKKEFSLNIFGYFQSREFNELVYDSISFLVRPSISVSDEIVMHLRGGDINDVKGALRYYYKVLETLPSCEIKIVTNSPSLIERVRSDFSRHVFVDVSSSAAADFLRLAGARQVILAPSTFSWWAVRLGKAEVCYAPTTIVKSLGPPNPLSLCEVVCSR